MAKITVLLLMVLLASCSGKNTAEKLAAENSPESVAKAMTQYIEEGRSEFAQAMIDPEVIAQRGDIENIFENTTVGIQNNGGIKKITTTEITRHGSNAVVETFIQFNNGLECTTQVQVVKHADTWYVRDFSKLLKSLEDTQSAPVWVPLPVNPNLTSEQTLEIVNKLKTHLSEPELLKRASKDLALPGKWGMGSDEQCAAEIDRRLFVRSGEADTDMGKVPAIHIGLEGTRKDREISGEIAMRLMDEVWLILGIDPPPKK